MFYTGGGNLGNSFRDLGDTRIADSLLVLKVEFLLPVWYMKIKICKMNGAELSSHICTSTLTYLPPIKPNQPQISSNSSVNAITKNWSITDQ